MRFYDPIKSCIRVNYFAECAFLSKTSSYNKVVYNELRHCWQHRAGNVHAFKLRSNVAYVAPRGTGPD